MRFTPTARKQLQVNGIFGERVSFFMFVRQKLSYRNHIVKNLGLLLSETMKQTKYIELFIVNVSLFV